MKHKLSYEWKNIYRILNTNDTSERGLTNKKKLEDALKTTGVFLTNEDIRALQETFGNAKGFIDYEKMS